MLDNVRILKLQKLQYNQDILQFPQFKKSSETAIQLCRLSVRSLTCPRYSTSSCGPDGACMRGACARLKSYAPPWKQHSSCVNSAFTLLEQFGDFGHAVSGSTFILKLPEYLIFQAIFALVFGVYMHA